MTFPVTFPPLLVQFTSVLPAQKKCPSSRQRRVTPMGQVERHEWHCQSHFKGGSGGEVNGIEARGLEMARGLVSVVEGDIGLRGEKGEGGMESLDDWKGVVDILSADILVAIEYARLLRTKDFMEKRNLQPLV
jgi:hypothetical protein